MMKFRERIQVRRRFFQLWRDKDGDVEEVMETMEAEFGASTNWLAILEMISAIIEFLERFLKKE